MRHDDQISDADAVQHERALIATARERASRSRARAASSRNTGHAGPPSAGPPEELAGLPLTAIQDLIPGYELQREIRRGGQGVVYQAIQRSTRRQVAIKVMREGPFAGVDDKARFDREVRILAQLNHPSIVTIHDSGAAAGCFYFVMNYIAGPPLDAYVRDTGPTLHETLVLFAKISDAVNSAHLRGIVHRDLKPSNIRIDADGRPHVLDFGLAKVEEGSSASESIMGATLTGQFIGSLPWASPEQAAGIAGGIDVRSDVYSLGVMLYETLTGMFPYVVCGHMLDVVHRIVHAEPIRPTAANTRNSGWRHALGRRRTEASPFHINAEVETIVLKCLHKDRVRRYQNAGELARDLRHYLAGEPIEARRDSMVYFLRKHVCRHRIGFGFACVLLLVLIGGLIVSLTFWRQAVTARSGLEDALRLADQREKDIRQVAEAQATMLGSVDPQTMGARLREDLLVEVERALSRSGSSPDDLSAHLKQLDALLSGTNFTNLGVRSIDRNVLAPALASIDRDYSGQPLVQARLRRTIATLYVGLGLYEPALSSAKAALATRRRALGDDHSDTLESLSQLTGLLSDRSRWPEAESYAREAMEGRRRLLGDDHPDTLESTEALARILRGLVRHSEAESYFRESLERRRRVLGDLHPDTLVAIFYLGLVLEQDGRGIEAEAYLREGLAGFQRVFGNDHERTQYRIAQMTRVLAVQGRAEEADGFLRQLVSPHLLVRGDDYSESFRILDKIAINLFYIRKHSEAEPYYRQAMEGRRRMQGDDHPATMRSISGVGVVLWIQCKLSEAELYFQEALERRRRVLGDRHPDTLESNSNMGLLMQSAGRLVEAEQFFREALEGERLAVGGGNQAAMLFRTMNLGINLVRQGRFAAAEPYCREALEGFRRASDVEAPMRTLKCASALGQALCGLGRLDEAESLGAEAVRGARVATVFVPVGLLGNTLLHHAQTLLAMGCFEDARAELTEAQQLPATVGQSTERTKEINATFAALYDAWHAAEPGIGYDAAAAEWRARLDTENTLNSAQPERTP